ncbi:enoyl-CoA hydratase/isomerase family protein [Egicoccus halophilus]|uniref:3-hydroxybutyryl-CoA dehydratase n=1 Tax=Egicoccus halophilus TaxID=1670830 RepID=A0A8J3ET22_9ACTN|nr:enoyl-CoA hydratase/isomerase family protein [Egicoccus halophilus]GGI04299.1 3-hydroxybutyryl-CoA dehydratase [Egicoccus halophilus]
MTDVVGYEVQDAVAHVTIRRPDKRNAMSLEVFAGLGACARRAGQDPAVGAVVVAGEGGTFSAGIDLAVFGEQLQGGVDPGFVAELQAAFTAFEELDKPTLAAIEGHCLGAGIQLALACHLRAVAPDAALAVKEADWGLVPDLGGSWRLPRLVGLGRATELTMTARTVGADEALAMGLVELALGSGDPRAEAHAVAAKLAAGPGALRRAPRLLRENLDRGRESALAAEARTQVACVEGHDFREAVSARLEGRAPAFRGT